MIDGRAVWHAGAICFKKRCSRTLYIDRCRPRLSSVRCLLRLLQPEADAVIGTVLFSCRGFRIPWRFGLSTRVAVTELISASLAKQTPSPRLARNGRPALQLAPVHGFGISASSHWAHIVPPSLQPALCMGVSRSGAPPMQHAKWEMGTMNSSGRCQGSLKFFPCNRRVFISISRNSSESKTSRLQALDTRCRRAGTIRTWICRRLPSS